MTQSGKHGILYGIQQNLLKSSINTFYSTVNVPNVQCIIRCEFEDHWSDASPKMTQSGKHWAFRGIFSKVLKLIPNCSKRSKYTPLWVGGSLEMFGITFKTSAECSAEDSVFSRLCHISLIAFPKAPQTHTGVYFDHLEHFVISFKTFKKFRGRFRVFQIVSY